MRQATMIPIGEFSTLQVVALHSDGAVLGDGDEEVLLPLRFAPKGVQVGQELTVFVYTDSEDQPIATTETPYAVVSEFALLEVVDTSQHGAFLNWGLGKDLFVPNNQQYQPMRRGQRYVVAVYLDDRTNRVAAASRLGPYFDYDLRGLRIGEEVSLLAYGFSDLGTQVVVENRYCGLIYASDTFRSIKLGDELTGYIRAIRPDNRLDVSLRRSGREAVTDAVDVVLRALDGHGGVLELSDESSPDEIYSALGISKKAFKMSVGKLYKARRIALEEGRLRLLTKAGAR